MSDAGGVTRKAILSDLFAGLEHIASTPSLSNFDFKVVERLICVRSGAGRSSRKASFQLASRFCNYLRRKATWRRDEAAHCKSAYPGLIQAWPPPDAGLSARRSTAAGARFREGSSSQQACNDGRTQTQKAPAVLLVLGPGGAASHTDRHKSRRLCPLPPFEARIKWRIGRNR